MILRVLTFIYLNVLLSAAKQTFWSWFIVTVDSGLPTVNCQLTRLALIVME